MVSCCSSTNGESEKQAWISLGDQPNQTKSFAFPKRTFRLKKPIYHSFQSSSFKRWPWLHYDHINDKAFCFTCLKAWTTGILFSGVYSRSDNAFVICGYTNWKDASQDKKCGFPLYERLHFHWCCTGICARSHRDTAEMNSTEHEKLKAVNHA